MAATRATTIPTLFPLVAFFSSVASNMMSSVSSPPTTQGTYRAMVRPVVSPSPGQSWRDYNPIHIPQRENRCSAFAGGSRNRGNPGNPRAGGFHGRPENGSRKTDALEDRHRLVRARQPRLRVPLDYHWNGLRAHQPGAGKGEAGHQGGARLRGLVLLEDKIAQRIKNPPVVVVLDALRHVGVMPEHGSRARVNRGMGKLQRLRRDTRGVLSAVVQGDNYSVGARQRRTNVASHVFRIATRDDRMRSIRRVVPLRVGVAEKRESHAMPYKDCRRVRVLVRRSGASRGDSGLAQMLQAEAHARVAAVFKVIVGHVHHAEASVDEPRHRRRAHAEHHPRRGIRRLAAERTLEIAEGDVRGGKPGRNAGKTRGASG